MSVLAFDHVAIPVTEPKVMMDFYRRLGFGVADYDAWLATKHPVCAVQLGNNKINMHAPELWQDSSFDLRGPTAQPGCGDFCFVWSSGLDSLKQTLKDVGAPIAEGPIERTGGGDGGRAKGITIHTRDPEQNLLEFIVYNAAV